MFELAASLVLLLVACTRGSLLHYDEFNDGSKIDESRWNILVTGSPYNQELQFYTNRTENIFLRNGRLVIKPIKESYGGRDYTSGRVYSKFAWKYGRVDVRAKLSDGFGLWPAIWLLPRDEVHGGWPSSGDIAIIETRGQELNIIQNAIHYGTCCSDINSESSGRIDMSCTIADFHVYSMDWTPTYLVFRVDGKPYYSVNLDRYLKESLYNEKGAPFNEYFYLVLNVAVGGNFLDNPTPSTVWKYPDAEMQVDFVRVYPLEDIAQLRCIAKSDSSSSDLCAAVSWACNKQTFAGVSAACTQELSDCCSMGCDTEVLLDLVSDLYTLYDSIISNEGSCDFSGTAESRYILNGGAPPKVQCLVRDEATVFQICGSMTWACSNSNTFADVTAECTEGSDVLLCCSAGAQTCDESRLREAGQVVFQAYYDKIPISTSCDFGGTTYLSEPLVRCVDGFNIPLNVCK